VSVARKGSTQTAAPAGPRGRRGLDSIRRADEAAQTASRLTAREPQALPSPCAYRSPRHIDRELMWAADNNATSHCCIKPRSGDKRQVSWPACSRFIMKRRWPRDFVNRPRWQVTRKSDSSRCALARARQAPSVAGALTRDLTEFASKLQRRPKHFRGNLLRSSMSHTSQCRMRLLTFAVLTVGFR
jgi:hypothetical protein